MAYNCLNVPMRCPECDVDIPTGIPRICPKCGKNFTANWNLILDELNNQIDKEIGCTGE
jgi:RNA polymerase subunit RPABC4/transcription elongation factor Spt4